MVNRHGSDKNSTGMESGSDDNSHDRHRGRKRIAVIGAGFSGLTAAAELKRLGRRFRSNTLFVIIFV